MFFLKNEAKLRRETASAWLCWSGQRPSPRRVLCLRRTRTRCPLLPDLCSVLNGTDSFYLNQVDSPSDFLLWILRETLSPRKRDVSKPSPPLPRFAAVLRLHSLLGWFGLLQHLVICFKATQRGGAVAPEGVGATLPRSYGGLPYLQAVFVQSQAIWQFF